MNSATQTNEAAIKKAEALSRKRDNASSKRRATARATAKRQANRANSNA